MNMLVRFHTILWAYYECYSELQPSLMNTINSPKC